MNINRNNYEEYFLLYADNELSAEVKAEVDQFVKENVDLREELLMFRQAVLKPDNSILMDKTMLRKEASFINHKNYEERFIEYHDDELTKEQESEVMEFIGANKLQAEFALFAQAKIQPEQIPFPAKYSLYRKEEDEKVIYFRWWIAAAAILVGVGLWTGGSFLMNNNNKGLNSDFTVSKIPDFSSSIAKQQQPDPQQGIQQLTAKKQTLPTPVNPVNSLVKNSLKEDKTQIRDKKINDQILVQTPVKNIDRKEDQRSIADIPKQDPSRTITDPVIAVDPEPYNENVTPRPENNFAHTASYVPGVEEKSDNYAFFNITSEEFKKSRLGGFLKKVKRVVGRKLPFHNEKQNPEVAIN